MNNFEIIEFEMSILKSYPGYSAIISTAKRMAEENEQLKMANSELAKTFSGLMTEIIFLKTELKKRPKVVWCEECNSFECCLVRKSYGLDFCSDGEGIEGEAI